MANFGGTVKLTGEKEYQLALRNITASLRETGSQLTSITSNFDNTDKSMMDTKNATNQLNQVLEKQTTAYNNLKSTYDTMNTKYQKQEEKLKSLKSTYDTEKQTLEQIGKTLGTTSKEYEDQKKVVDDLEKEIKQTTEAQTQNELALSKMRTQLNNTETAINKTTREMDNLGEKTENVGEGFTVFKGVLSNLASQVLTKVVDGVKNFAGQMIQSAADVKAANSQYTQTFGEFENQATQAIQRVANSTGILETRLKVTGAQIFAFARSNGATVPEAMELMETALQSAADGAAYYDKSLEESAETLQSFLKGNYANDAALGVSATEFTRNAKAAELFGKKYNDLTEIQKQQTLLKMVTDSQKVSGAMGQAAREADGWENVQGNLNEAWKQFQANVGTPFLQALIPVIQKVTKSLGNLTEKINWNKFNKDVEKSLGKLQDGLEWVIDNKEIFIGAMKAMMAAFTIAKINSFTKSLSDSGKKMLSLANDTKTLIKATIAQAAAQEGATVATTAGTIATKLFNAAWKANPIGLVVTGLTLLGGALIGVTKYVQEHTKETDKNTIATQKLSEQQKELTKTINSNVRERQKSIESAGNEAVTAEVLAKKLESLIGIENKSVSQKEAIKRIVDQLNQTIPNLNLAYDEEADKLNKSTEAIKSQIKAQKELLVAKAAEEKLTAIAKDMADLELKKADLIEQQTKNQNALNKAKKELNDFTSKYSMQEIQMNRDLSNEYAKLTGEVVKRRSNLNETNTAIQENTNSMNKLNSEFDKTNNLATNLFDKSEIMNKLAELTELCNQAGVKIPESVVNGINEGKYILPTSVEDMKTLINLDSLITKAKNDGIKIPNSLSQGIQEGSITVPSAIEYINTLISFQSMIDKAGLDGVQIPSSLANGIISGKVSVDSATQQMNNWINFQTALNKANIDGTNIPITLSNKILGGQVSVTNAVTQMNNWVQFQEALNKANMAGTDIPTKLQQGILSGKIKPADAIRQLNDDMSREASKQPGKMRSSGSQIGNDYLSGVQSGVNNGGKRGAVFGSINSLGTGMNNSLKSSINAHSPSREAATIGGYFLDGVYNGVSNRSKRNSIFGAVANFGNSLLQNLRNALREKSPSKATEEMGVYLLEGLSNGIKEQTKPVLNQVSTLGTNITKSLSGSLDTGALNNISIPNSVNPTYNSSNNLNNINTLDNQESMVEAFKTALKEMKIELDDEQMARFVTNTIQNEVYS